MIKQVIYYANKEMTACPLHTMVNGKCSCGHYNCKCLGKHPRTIDVSKPDTEILAAIRHEKETRGSPFLGEFEINTLT